MVCCRMPCRSLLCRVISFATGRGHRAVYRFASDESAGWRAVAQQLDEVGGVQPRQRGGWGGFCRRCTDRRRRRLGRLALAGTVALAERTRPTGSAKRVGGKRAGERQTTRENRCQFNFTHRTQNPGLLFCPSPRHQDFDTDSTVSQRFFTSTSALMRPCVSAAGMTRRIVIRTV